jgi:hypothetical protein
MTVATIRSTFTVLLYVPPCFVPWKMELSPLPPPCFGRGVESRASSLLWQMELSPLPPLCFGRGVGSRASSLLCVLLLLAQASTFFLESARAQVQRGPTHRLCPLPALAEELSPVPPPCFGRWS